MLCAPTVVNRNSLKNFLSIKNRNRISVCVFVCTNGRKDGYFKTFLLFSGVMWLLWQKKITLV